MKTINVHTSGSYPVHIGSGILKDLTNHLQSFFKCLKIVIVSDSNVWELYGDRITEIARSAEKTVYHFVFPAGEGSKNGETYLNILNFLAENRISRSDLLIALGGGVVGDITGFAAATYLRGIAFIQIPTTLLAMVDSSVGGKTAIDLPAGKNLVGAFYQPSLVLCDTDMLDTLPDRIFCDGCAEVIKYAMLYDPVLYEHLSNKGLSLDREGVISRCIALKADVVAEDEFDTGLRQMLNFGHTVGHSIEKESSYTISHGQAVAIGMAIVTKASVNLEMCDADVYSRLIALLKKFKLPFSVDYTAEQLCQHALSDKKRSANAVNLIVPNTIGNCKIVSVPITELKSLIEAGL